MERQLKIGEYGPVESISPAPKKRWNILALLLTISIVLLAIISTLSVSLWMNSKESCELPEPILDIQFSKETGNTGEMCFNDAQGMRRCGSGPLNISCTPGEKS